jgi:hypothetical protein
VIYPVVFQKKDGDYYFLDEPEKKATSEAISIVIGPESQACIRMVNSAYEVVRPIKPKEIPNAEKVEEGAISRYPKISFDVYWKVLCFLRKVYDVNKAEGCVLLTLNRNTPIAKQEYGIKIPIQKVSGASVEMKELHQIPLAEGEFFAGSIHSHPSFGAYQSGTDHSDEIPCDGLHVTLGKLSQETPEIHQRFSFAGKFYTPPTPYVITESPNKPKVEIVQLSEAVKSGISAMAKLIGSDEHIQKALEVSLSTIVIDTIKAEQKKAIAGPNFDVPPEWMERVSGFSSGVYVGGRHLGGSVKESANDARGTGSDVGLGVKKQTNFFPSVLSECIADVSEFNKWCVKQIEFRFEKYAVWCKILQMCDPSLIEVRNMRIDLS